MHRLHPIHLQSSTQLVASFIASLWKEVLLTEAVPVSAPLLVTCCLCGFCFTLAAALVKTALLGLDCLTSSAVCFNSACFIVFRSCNHTWTELRYKLHSERPATCIACPMPCAEEVKTRTSILTCMFAAALSSASLASLGCRSAGSSYMLSCTLSDLTELEGFLLWATDDVPIISPHPVELRAAGCTAGQKGFSCVFFSRYPHWC